MSGRHEEEEKMTARAGKVTCDLTISVDGYAAGLNQTEDRPFGDDGGDGWANNLHAWFGEGPDVHPEEFARLMTAKAFIMGRNMFGPVRGEWDRQWKGWWGDNPPYHGPVFVLTHYPRDPQPMEGGTTFYFVTDGIDAAMKLAREAAGDGDISVHGGATTVNQYLAAGMIDEVRLHIAPLTLGAGTRVFDGVPQLKLEQLESRAAASVTHVMYRVLS
jgi:dihydrofolate reductase